MTGYDGVERRANPAGRRDSDTCSEHCFYVAKMAEHSDEYKEHKHDQSEINRGLSLALSGKAPMSLVVSLIATVALCTILSVGYAWKSTETVRREMVSVISDLQKDLNQQVMTQNREVNAKLIEIKTGLAVAQSRQEDIKELIQKHMIPEGEIR